ncbi:FAD-binding oxidoreductase [Undibacterium sp.]|jgi:FAD-dependent oxidoreductase domain-containing protein 1|uniref:NAD(P)/FAD-dependent oxidoreductase n=1 Tax=Undibacterium sp. TaxID=1914977 RepID=UPI002BD5B8E5|nr:FAD-binding oxidoreductase [Undibacterium sp.]HTD06219.1 FAD-binding oxidoreductase [Undibacterium sp.]
MNTPKLRYDAVIIGGAIMGSSVAYFLKQADPAMEVAVIEPDPTYEYASTVRASGGARRLFSCPENIQMSNFSIDFIKRFPVDMAVHGEPAPIDWVQQGYLFIVQGAHMRLLEENAKIQQALGAEIHLLDRKGLRDYFPSMHVDDLDGGAYSPGDGWCDPSSFLQGMRKKARSLGVEYIQDTVASLRHTGIAVTHAVLASGGEISAEVFVNASGAWSSQISEMIGMRLPVSPLRRFEHFFTGQKKIEPLPYVKDLHRLAFRPEGDGYSGGLVNSDEPRGFNFDVDHDYFDRVVWPALAHRFPSAFEGIKCHRTWSGLYEQCELDGNPVIGNWKGRFDNFYVLAGFSGHGMMHAPAAGRGLAELITGGRYETIDLCNFGYGRVERNVPYPERGIL